MGIFFNFVKMICNIIACGDSLRGKELYLDGFTIAINNAHLYFDYDIVVCMDDPKHLQGNPTNIHTQSKYNVGRGWKLAPQRILMRSTDTIGNFNVSTYAAINIALNLGYKDVRVYGADERIDKYIHFYDTEEATQEQKDHYNLLFKRCRSFKSIILNSLKEDESVKFINIVR